MVERDEQEELDTVDDMAPGPDDLEPESAATAAPHVAVDELRDLVIYLAGSLTDAPDEVEVVAEQRGPTIHLSLRVPESELGRVIGRQGRIARALRTVVTIAASRHNLRASLDIEG